MKNKYVLFALVCLVLTTTAKAADVAPAIIGTCTSQTAELLKKIPTPTATSKPLTPIQVIALTKFTHGFLAIHDASELIHKNARPIIRPSFDDAKEIADLGKAVGEREAASRLDKALTDLEPCTREAFRVLQPYGVGSALNGR